MKKSFKSLRLELFNYSKIIKIVVNKKIVIFSLNIQFRQN